MPAAGINFSNEETVAQVHASHMPTAAASGSEDARTRRRPQDNSGMTRWRIVAMPVEYAACQENKIMVTFS